MRDPQCIGKIVEQAFDRIHRENMQGMPILNASIAVQAAGFQHHGERIVGVIITPWLMAVVLLPAEGEDWSELVMGRKVSHDFPAGPYQFLVNEIDGIGFCQMHSLHSPMNGFSSQQQAEMVAENFIRQLMTADSGSEDISTSVSHTDDSPEVNLDDFATIEAHKTQIPIELITETTKPMKKKLDRRSLLLGQFQGGD